MVDNSLPIQKWQLKLLALLLVANSVYAVAWLGSYVYHNAVIELMINVGIIGIAMITIKSKYLEKRKYYNIVVFYFVWMLLQSVRGILGCEMYMDYRQLVDGVVMLSLPILLYLFAYPSVVQYVLRKWLFWGGLIFLVFTIWNVGPNCLYLAPISLFACFFFDLPKKWKIAIGIILFIWLSTIMDRANLLRSAMMIACAIAFKYRRFVSDKLLKIVHHLFFFVPLILLLLGFLGNFNFFKYLQDDNDGRHTEQIKKADGSVKEVDVFGDTRTFIYTEVLDSSVKHGYVLWGRTPARGNDDYFFESLFNDGKGNQLRKNERHVNEVGFLNVYTWIGLIGIILYSLLYLKASLLALRHSNNSYIKFLGVFVAFRWALGWIEDINLFFIQSIILWMLIAMCMSEKFRKMSDADFRMWFLKCLPK